MKIAVIGAGAMGSIFGGSLSKHNEVYMIDVSPNIVDRINKFGISINEFGKDNIYYPRAFTSTEGIGQVDLILLFVKAIYSRDAMNSVSNLIGSNSYVMTLQNGGGHEHLLREFVDERHIIIGTTEDDGQVLSDNSIKRGGNGVVNLGMLTNDNYDFLIELGENLGRCGFKPNISQDIEYIIWKKLSRNTTLSAVTGLLQCRIGYVYENKNAWELVKILAEEFVLVASEYGLTFSEEEILEDVKETAINSKYGVTSICADIRAKRKTEVDTISGFILKKATVKGVPVEAHKFIVNAIHALENRE